MSMCSQAFIHNACTLCSVRELSGSPQSTSTSSFVNPLYRDAPTRFTSPRLRAFRGALRDVHMMCSDTGPSSDSVADADMKDGENFLLDDTKVAQIVAGTMLEGCELGCSYDSREDGFDHAAFFNRLEPLDGVPSLVVGVTESGGLFGGYTSHGFAARDDYREATTERGLFVFAVRDEEVVEAAPTDRVLYDFYDYAIRFGAGLLGIPMNPSKHIMKANVGTSSCAMPDGCTSVFGEFSMAPIDRLQVLVSKKYIDAAGNGGATGAKGGLFGRLFG